MSNWRGWIVLGLLLCVTVGGHAADARIKKVLPHYLDLQGRHMLAPSLYERDAYQAHLRQNPDERSGLRFDVNWTGGGWGGGKVTLRLELLSSGRELGDVLVLEKSVKRPAFFSRWSSILLEGDEFKRFGELVAWRATLWRDGKQIAEQKSFLW